MNGAGREVLRLLALVRVLVGGEGFGGIGDVETGRRHRLQEARRLELIQPRQMGDILQPELDQEGLRGAIGDRAARGTFAPADLHPADLHQGVDGALGEGDAANVLDLGPGDGLVVGDDRQGFDGRLGQALLFRLLLAQQEGQIGGGADLVFSGNTAKVDAALLIDRFKRGRARRPDRRLRAAMLTGLSRPAVRRPQRAAPPPSADARR